MRHLRRVAVVVGLVVMALAVRGMFVDLEATNPPALARWVLGLAVAHDLLLAPAAAAGAAALWRWAPRWWGGPATLALVLSALFISISVPLVRGFGRRPDTPSALPRDYGANLAVLVAGLWLVTAAVVVVRRRTRGRAV